MQVRSLHYCKLLLSASHLGNSTAVFPSKHTGLEGLLMVWSSIAFSEQGDAGAGLHAAGSLCCCSEAGGLSTLALMNPLLNTEVKDECPATLMQTLSQSSPAP